MDKDISTHRLNFFLKVILVLFVIFIIFDIPILINWEMRNLYGIDIGDLYTETGLIYRVIGYICFFIVIGLIILGFLLKKGKLSKLGTYLFFLPTIASYMAYMAVIFFGLSIIQIIWLPLMDLFLDMKVGFPEYPDIAVNLDLGSVILLPAYLLIYITSFGPNTEFTQMIIWNGIIWIGLFIFCYGVIVWFQAHYKKQVFLNFSIYEYTQHPQYLGFLIFSYGLFIRGYFEFNVMGGFYFDDFY